MTPAAIILAAGASTRLGQPKQLILFESETLLDRTIRTAREASCAPVVVILGANADLIQQQCNLSDTTILRNAKWQEGMASSLRLGIQSIPDAEAAMILTCDMPAITPEHLRVLAASGTLKASRYANRTAVPAFFPRALFPQLLALTGDQGARAILAEAPSIDLPGGELDLDTPEDLARLRATR